MKRRFRLILSVMFTACTVSQAYAQSDSFAEFRKRILNDYNDFRSSIFENYDKFLEGAWDEFDQVKGEKSNPKPKPHKAPTVDNPVVEAPVTDIPAPQKPTPKPPTPKADPVKEADTQAKPRPDTKPSAGTDKFTIGETELSVPHVEYNIARRLNTPQDYAAHWRGMAKSDLKETVLPEMKGLADRYGLNDYLLFEAVNSYVDTRFPDAHSSARKSLAHYILTGLGYDVRLGKTDAGTGMLLVPFKQMVYARPYLNFDGRKYFIFADENVDLSSPDNMRISSCQLPTDADCGNPLDLVIKNLKIPYQAGEYNVSYGDINISGEFNKAIIPLLYRYPQMPTADYARSNILPEVREQVVEQLKAQLEPIEKSAAVDKLLQFVQKGFDYAYDEDYHGFEKPYFLEETLFYPKNDCEDRAIFYTYLLWEVLGIPNQLICYPGHESASVALDHAPDIDKVSSYTQQGTTYYISDPTYIGAVTGMCMPNYKGEAPTIDFTYE